VSDIPLAGPYPFLPFLIRLSGFFSGSGTVLTTLGRTMRWELCANAPETLNGPIPEYMETIPEPGTSLKPYAQGLEKTHTAESAIKTVQYHV